MTITHEARHPSSPLRTAAFIWEFLAVGGLAHSLPEPPSHSLELWQGYRWINWLYLRHITYLISWECWTLLIYTQLEYYEGGQGPHDMTIRWYCWPSEAAMDRFWRPTLWTTHGDVMDINTGTYWSECLVVQSSCKSPCLLVRGLHWGWLPSHPEWWFWHRDLWRFVLNRGLLLTFPWAGHSRPWQEGFQYKTVLPLHLWVSL